MSQSSINSDVTYWLVVGPAENWSRAFKGNPVWGLPVYCEAIWARVEIGDVLLFYVTNPVKGLIGYGTVAGKNTHPFPFWPQELARGNVRWPLHIVLNLNACLNEDNWGSNRLPINRSGISIQRAIQRIPKKGRWR